MEGMREGKTRGGRMGKRESGREERQRVGAEGGVWRKEGGRKA